MDIGAASQFELETELLSINNLTYTASLWTPYIFTTNTADQVWHLVEAKGFKSSLFPNTCKPWENATFVMSISVTHSRTRFRVMQN